MKSFLSNHGHYLFVLLVLLGWLVTGIFGDYFLNIFYFLYVALFLGLLNMIKYRHLDLYSVPNSEIKRQIKSLSFITILTTVGFFTFKLHIFFTIGILIIFVIIFILSISDIVLKILELKKRRN